MARVLVLDDEQVWRDLCRERLQDLGHEVLATGSARRTFDLLATASPDLVILDLRMPVSGRAMLEAVRRRRPGLPVVIHTAYAGYGDDPDLAAADAFAVKSPDLSALVCAVGAALRRRGLALREAPR